MPMQAPSPVTQVSCVKAPQSPDASLTQHPSVLYRWIEACFWRCLLAGLRPIDEGGRYAAWEAEPLTEPTLCSLVDELPPDAQEAVLRYVTRRAFKEEIGAVEADCHCRWCGPARQRQQLEAQTPRDSRVRAALLQTLKTRFQPRGRLANGLTFRCTPARRQLSKEAQ